MALKAGYKGIKKIGTGLKLTTEGTLSLDGSGPSGSVNLDDLDDVAITEPANGNILVYDSTDEEWKNAAPTSAADKADITAIGTNETGDTSSKAYAVGEHFYKNGKFCTAIASIASGATFTLNTNYVESTVADSMSKFKLLWTNPNPSNSWAGGTYITSISDDYDYYIMRCVGHTSRPAFIHDFTIFKQADSTDRSDIINGVIFNYVSAAKCTNAYRLVKYKNGTFDVGSGTTEDLTTDNEFLVPFQIYGVKL